VKDKLENIATIRTGVYARAAANGDAYYMQVKDVDALGNLKLTDKKQNLRFTATFKKHQLNTGDILLVAKGDYHPATLYIEGNHPAVASTSFLIICLNDEYALKVLPEYIAWYLNHPIAQKYFDTFSRGTSIQSISISILGELNIDIPDLDRQRKIVAIHKLNERTNELNATIQKLKQQQLEYQLLKATKENQQNEK
jgi:restriction endonuclease S subunit